jgi:hypothetical protein
MCFQCMILMREMYKLWMNEFFTISITKSWDVKFVMCIVNKYLKNCETKIISKKSNFYLHT